jgi:putative transposase
VTAVLHTLGAIIVGFLAPRTALLAENLLLRQQLIVLRRGVARPRMRPFDRWLIATLAGRFRALLEMVVLVRPETVIGWHRAGWRLFWRWRSRSCRPPGRPPIDADRRALIRRMWRDNPTWGEDRIAGEMPKLGHGVDPRTVAKCRPAGLARGRGQRWTTFVRNHLQETWACDFLVVVTARFRILYVFVVLSLGRRRIVHLGVTEYPSSAWTTQRMVEAVADAELAPRFLIHDRDAIYGADFRRRVGGLGTRLLATPPRAPKSNAYCERVIGTIRRDCLDHVIVLGERHAERILKEYVGYYHGRPHRGLHMQPPDGARHLPPPRPPPGTPIAATPILAGLHHSYGFADPRPPPNASCVA